MSEPKTSENFHGQDEYHQAYFHDIDAPAPLKADRVDPNLPDLDKPEPVDPDLPEAPVKSGREDEGKAEAKPEPKKPEPRAPRSAAADSK